MTKSTDTSTDYSHFDRPEILNYVFHPRRDYALSTSSDSIKQLHFTVGDGVDIGAALHFKDKSAPVILFFHGNGEIVSDYDDLGRVFLEAGINFLPVDYRGYGRSTGTPTISAMMNDCHILFDHATTWLSENGFTGPLIVMGRSLGSASAIELAASLNTKIDALIIESGFAYIMPLIRLLGITTDYPGVTEENGPKNYEKIKMYTNPTLIIHAEYDHIIPFTDGVTLYENSEAVSKNMVEIKGADHNNIFYHGIHQYMRAIKDIASEIS